MSVFSDQLGRKVNLPSPPKRIISTVPSQTELLFYLGLNEKIIGITKFCRHPEHKYKSTTRIGGTKQLDIDLIRALEPDLIIANKEENDRAQIEELMKFCPVWISDVSNLDGAIDMIKKIGTMVDREIMAKAVVRSVTEQFDHLDLKPLDLRAAYLIWRKPYMVAGKGTFIDNMLEKCGFINAFTTSRYPKVDAARLIQAQPDIILLSSEPYHFKEKHITEFINIVPSAAVKLVDGEFFSWYGSRLILAPTYFKELITALRG